MWCDLAHLAKKKDNRISSGAGFPTDVENMGGCSNKQWGMGVGGNREGGGGQNSKKRG